MLTMRPPPRALKCHRLAAQQARRGQVHRQGALPVRQPGFGVGIIGRAERDAGVIDQHVDVTKPGHRLAPQPLAVGGFAQVGL
jgi:hypothetical protein